MTTEDEERFLEIVQGQEVAIRQLGMQLELVRQRHLELKAIYLSNKAVDQVLDALKKRTDQT